MLREETQLHHFEHISEVAAYNIVGMEFLRGFLPAFLLTILNKLPLLGGLRKTSLIEASLIDHFIPFLPLEKRHIEKCIISDFKRLGIDRPTFTDIEYVFFAFKLTRFSIEMFMELILSREISSNSISYYRNIFSTSGCKRLSKKVAMFADRYR